MLPARPRRAAGSGARPSGSPTTRGKGTRKAPATAASGSTSTSALRRSERPGRSSQMPALYDSIMVSILGVFNTIFFPGGEHSFQLRTAEGRGFCWGSSILLAFWQALFPRAHGVRFPGDDSNGAPSSTSLERKVEAFCREACHAQFRRISERPELARLPYIGAHQESGAGEYFYADQMYTMRKERARDEPNPLHAQILCLSACTRVCTCVCVTGTLAQPQPRAAAGLR